MFKKLKDKITEEVKQSPLKSVQQLAQAVVSPSSSSVFEPSNSNDKFCIEDDDIGEDNAAQSVDQRQVKPGGFTSVTLRGQTTSPAHDPTYTLRTGPSNNEADSIFPAFESQPTNYHVQSDWESASEVEDRSSQLEHINKESLFDAYRKVYNRYNKIKNKYHELVTHYRRLERENEKAKNVLTETQDKALKRISELKEQCVLEQQAKAHLEEALRNEIEERDHLINTLKTKIQYLKEATENSATANSQNGSANLIDFTENTSDTKVSDSFGTPFNKDKFEHALIRCSSVLSDGREKLKTLLDKSEDVVTNKVQLIGNNAELVLKDEKNVLAQHSLDDNSIRQTLMNIMSDLDREVNNLKDLKENSLQKEDNSSISTLDTDVVNAQILPLSDSIDICSEDGLVKTVKATNDKSINVDISNEEHNKQNTFIIDIKTENDKLKEQLTEKLDCIENLKSELNLSKHILSSIEGQLKKANENIENLKTNEDVPNLSPYVDHDVFKELNMCVKYMFETKLELNRLEDNKMKLELDIKGNNNKIEQLTFDKTDLQNKIEDLENQIKSLLESMHNTEEGYTKQISELKNENLFLNEENKRITSTVGDSISNVQKYKTELGLAVELNNKLSQDLLSLNKKNSDYNEENEQLKIEITEMQEKLKQALSENLVIQEKHADVSNELNTFTERFNSLLSERNELNNSIQKIEKDFEDHRQMYSSILKKNEELCYELESINKKYNEIHNEKIILQNEIDQLKSDLDNFKIKYNSLLDTTKKQNEEELSKRQVFDELCSEKDDLHRKIRDLISEGEDIKIQHSNAIEHKEKLTQELELLNEKHSKLNIEKNHIQHEFNKLEKDLLDIKDYNSELLNKISSLSLECSSKENIIGMLQDNLANVENDLAESKKSYNLLLGTKGDLAEQINLLNKEKDSAVSDSETMRNNLEEQQRELACINKKYNALLYSFEEKCDDLDKKNLLISSLESEKQILVKNLNDAEASNDNIKISNTILSHGHRTNINTLENLKLVQRNLREFFLSFKNEIHHELEDIKSKISNDLKHHIEHVLIENKNINAVCEELIYKNKEGIDSYNSQIKTVHEEIKKQHYEDVTSLDDKMCDTIEKSKAQSNNSQCEINDELVFYKNKCSDLEIHMKQAISIINSMKKYIKQVQKLDSPSSDVFSGEFHDELSNAEHFNHLSRQISKLESFFKNYEIKYNNGISLQLSYTSQLNHENQLNESCSNDSVISNKKSTAGVANSNNLVDNNASNIFNIQHFENGDCENMESSKIIECLEKKNKLLLLCLLEIHESYKQNLKTLIENYENKLIGKYEDDKSLEKENINFISEAENQIERLRHNLDEKGDTFEKLYEEYQQSRNNRDEDIQKLRINYEKEMREQDKKWRNCLDRRLIEEESRHKAEVSRLTSEWIVIRKDLEKASRVAVTALESGSTSGEMLRHQVQALTLQLNQLQEKRCESCGLNIFPNEENRLKSRSIQDCTEMEYLRNIMYTYMMGKETLVLAKVLCALLKFDDAQTKDILLKEEQKITLLGQLGIL